MELHVIIPGRAAELVARVIDGRLEIVPPEPAPPVDEVEKSPVQGE